MAACRPRRQPMDLRQHDLWQQSYNHLFQEFSVNDFLEQYPNPSTSVASNFQLIKCPGQLSSSSGGKSLPVDPPWSCQAQHV